MNKGQLSYILHNLIRGEKVAIIDNLQEDIDLIRNVILILPPSLRLVPFSTFVADSRRQTAFQLIQISENNIDSKQGMWKLIDLQQNKKEDFHYILADSIFEHDKETLKKFHNIYEELPKAADTIKKFDYSEKQISIIKSSSHVGKIIATILSAKIASKISQEICAKNIQEATQMFKKVNIIEIPEEYCLEHAKLLYENRHVQEFESFIINLVKETTSLGHKKTADLISKILNIVSTSETEKYFTLILDFLQENVDSYYNILSEIIFNPVTRLALIKSDFVKSEDTMLSVISKLISINVESSVIFLNEILDEPKNFDELQKFSKRGIVLVNEFLSERLKDISETVVHNITIKIINTVENMFSQRKTRAGPFSSRKKFEFNTVEVVRYLQIISPLVFIILEFFAKSNLAVHKSSESELKRWYKELIVHSFD